MARAALAGLLACVLALAGCATLADLGQLREDLDAAGYDATGINHNTTNGHSVLSIQVSMPDSVPTDADAEKVAEVVWTKTTTDFDQLTVAVNGAVRLDATADELADRFGARPEGAPEDDGGSSGTVVAVIVVLAVAAVFTGLLVLLWRRGRRPPPPVGPPPGGHLPYPPPRG